MDQEPRTPLDISHYGPSIRTMEVSGAARYLPVFLVCTSEGIPRAAFARLGDAETYRDGLRVSPHGGHRPAGERR